MRTLRVPDSVKAFRSHQLIGSFCRWLTLSTLAFSLSLPSLAAAKISEAAFIKKYCGGDCEAQLVADHDPNDVLSVAEHFLVQRYTESYKIIDTDMFVAAIAKIPTTSLTAYRGADSSKLKIKSVGQIIRFDRITSISAERFTAENFVKDQLLILKTKSAHSITRYSALGEQEFILLPGVQFKVDKIMTEKIDVSSEGQENIVDAQIVELSEI